MSALRAASMKMQQDGDPRKELADRVGDVSGIALMHNQILTAIYVRPEKTASGLYLTDATRKEDHWQGKVSMVIGKGPTAFKDDPENGVYFHGQDVAVGDWVISRPSDGFLITINGQLCRLLEEAHIKGKVPAPDAIF